MRKPKPGEFGGANWQAGDGANRSRAISILRRAQTSATNKYGIGGLEKVEHKKPRPITLATTPWKDDGK